MGIVETTRTRLTLAVGLALLLGLNLWLYAPLFDAQQKPYKGSIAAGYAGITRFVGEHPNPWGWNPQQYAGQPTQFSYPPLVPYGASALHWVTGMDSFQAYRVLVGAMACLGPVTLAFAFFYFTESVFWALALGLAYSMGSPIYGIFEKVDADRGSYYLPWRLLVLLKYGEAPHVAGLTVLPLVLVAVRWALPRRDFASLVVLAVGLAVAPLTNWLSAFSLTLALLLMLLTDWTRWPRLMAAGGLGYLLAAFWLTPEYVSTTLFNWPKDAYGYQVEQSHWPLYAGLLGVVLVVALVLRWADAPWVVRYSTVGLAAFLWIAGGFYWFNRDTLPESRRYALELELFLFLAAFAWCWMGWRSRENVDRFCVMLGLVAFLGAGAGQFKASVGRSAADWGSEDREMTLEYQMARWLEQAHPQGRVFATGGLRFRLNAWFPLHQVGGTFESGLRNRIAVDHYYQVRTGEASKPGEEAMDSRRELAAIGAEYVVVHDLGSEEYYKDIKNTAKFAELGPVVFAPTGQDRIHKLPFRSYAHLVKPEELPKDRWKEALPRFYEALVDAGRPGLRVVEVDPSHWRIEGPMPRGYQVSFSMNWDPGWRARQGGAVFEVGKNELGLIQLVPPGEGPIELEYGGTWQQKCFGMMSLAAWVVSIGLCIRSRSWRGSTSTPSS